MCADETMRVMKPLPGPCPGLVELGTCHPGLFVRSVFALVVNQVRWA